jgi:hypothetical protein
MTWYYSHDPVKAIGERVIQGVFAGLLYGLIIGVVIGPIMFVVLYGIVVWFYSEDTLQLFKSMLKNFPDIFDLLKTGLKIGIKYGTLVGCLSGILTAVSSVFVGTMPSFLTSEPEEIHAEYSLYYIIGSIFGGILSVELNIYTSIFYSKGEIPPEGILFWCLNSMIFFGLLGLFFFIPKLLLEIIENEDIEISFKFFFILSSIIFIAWSIQGFLIGLIFGFVFQWPIEWVINSTKSGIALVGGFISGLLFIYGILVYKSKLIRKRIF